MYLTAHVQFSNPADFLPVTQRNISLLVWKFRSYSISLSFKFATFIKTYSQSFKLAQVILGVSTFWFV